MAEFLRAERRARGAAALDPIEEPRDSASLREANERAADLYMYQELAAARSGEAESKRRREPEIEGTPEAIGQHIIDGMNNVNEGGRTVDSGIWYSYRYRESHPERWQDGYRYGHADPAYFERTDFLSWRLKPNKSASQAIRAWLRGLTIADCLNTVNALQLDAFRAAVGDAAFDAQFGDEGGEPPSRGPLTITQRSSSVVTRPPDAGTAGLGTIGKRPVKKGDRCYFRNHPNYYTAHPGGAWGGENVVCMGEKNGQQTWSGFGASNLTEDEMLDALVDACNEPPRAYESGGRTLDPPMTKERLLSDGYGLQLQYWESIDMDLVKSLRPVD